MASLMSPLAFQTSGKVALPTQLPQPKQPPKMEIAPLTQDQLVQALTYLLKVMHVTGPIGMHGYEWKMVSIALRGGGGEEILLIISLMHENKRISKEKTQDYLKKWSGTYNALDYLRFTLRFGQRNNSTN